MKNVGTISNSITGLMPSITITASTFLEFVKAVVLSYLGARKKISVIAEWSNNDFYTFEMTILSGGSSYGTITNLFNPMSYKNYNFTYNNNTLSVHNILCTNSNQYGSYLIINDDTQICWGTITYSIVDWRQWGYLFEAYASTGDWEGATITFARPFNGAPHVFLQGFSNKNAACGVEYGSINATHVVRTYLLRPVAGQTSATAYIDYLAIGSPS